MNIQDKLQTVVDEYNSITRRLNAITQERNDLLEKLAELRGAIKVLQELAKPISSEEVGEDSESNS